MTHDRLESVPTGHGRFASGIVLGLSLGIAAGHLLLFARRDVDGEVLAAAEDFPPLVATSGLFADVEHPVPDDVSFSIMEFDENSDVGRVKLSDQSPGEHLHYFPEAMSQSPDDAVEHSDHQFAQKSGSEGSLRMTAEVAHESAGVPEPLEPSPAAVPIDQQTSERERQARAIIAEELPDATLQEREVWYDVLQGLPAEDVKGILRMRKHIGLTGPSALSALLPTPLPLAGIQPPPATAIPQSVADSDDNLSPASRRLKQIEAHNRANRGTVAFKRLVPVLVEAPLEESPGVRISSVIRDMSQGELLPTGRTLDAAIDGPGFLQVRRGDEVRYTRDGRLTLDSAGRLKLLAFADEWLLDPPVVIPSAAQIVTISTTGEVSVTLAEGQQPAGKIRRVQFLNPEALHVETGGLYAKTAASGTPHVAATDGPRAHLVQGHLEQSNVDK